MIEANYEFEAYVVNPPPRSVAHGSVRPGCLADGVRV
jgi:hypothetical protein